MSSIEMGVNRELKQYTRLDSHKKKKKKWRRRRKKKKKKGGAGILMSSLQNRIAIESLHSHKREVLSH